MRNLRFAVLVGLVVAGAACTQKAADDANTTATTAMDKTKAAAATAVSATKEGAAVAVEASKKATDMTAGVVTDAWITAKVTAKFADEVLLAKSKINVDTADHVVTLNGTVVSAAGKDRAAEIARGTEGVTRVINKLIVT